MQKKPNFIKETQKQESEPLKPEIVNQRSKVHEGYDINYIVITAEDPIKLITAVNNYIGKFTFMDVAGGICFISDDGKNYVCQALVNRDLKNL